MFLGQVCVKSLGNLIFIKPSPFQWRPFFMEVILICTEKPIAFWAKFNVKMQGCVQTSRNEDVSSRSMKLLFFSIETLELKTNGLYLCVLSSYVLSLGGWGSKMSTIKKTYYTQNIARFDAGIGCSLWWYEAVIKQWNRSEKKHISNGRQKPVWMLLASVWTENG